LTAKPTPPPPLDALPEPARGALEVLREPREPADAESTARMRPRFRAMLAEALGEEAVGSPTPAAKSG